MNDFKKSQNYDQEFITKAVKSWRKHMNNTMRFKNDRAAAQNILENWEDYGESFKQTIFALEQMDKIGNG